jgi:hypothetical protein
MLDEPDKRDHKYPAQRIGGCDTPGHCDKKDRSQGIGHQRK